MNIREMIKELEKIEDAHGNIPMDVYCKCGNAELVNDVTFNEGYAGINYNKNNFNGVN